MTILCIIMLTILISLGAYAKYIHYKYQSLSFLEKMGVIIAVNTYAKTNTNFFIRNGCKIIKRFL